MHQCLRVPEIAAVIAEACAPDYRDAGSFGNGSKPKLGAVYALARTCRALHGPALDLLWYYQFGLQNLVKCLPTGLWRIWNKRERDAFDEWGKVVERDWCHELVTIYLFIRCSRSFIILDHSKLTRPEASPLEDGNVSTFMLSECVS